MKKNIIAISCYILLFAFGLTKTLKAEKEQPNIIIIYTDDQGYSDLGCYGAVGFETPHLDKMAAEGVRFTNFYAGSNICSPSRMAMLTGRYPVRAGMPKVLMHYSKTGIHKDEVTIAEMLKEQGYKTAIVGKWHLGHFEESLPLQHGFDEFYGLPFSNDLKVNGVLPFYKGNEVIEKNPDNSMLTTRYTEYAVQFIKENRNNPFFLYLAHSMPHTPLGVSDKFKGKSNLGLYGDVMMEIDWSVGEIMKQLKELDLDKETLVFFSSDNGPSLKQGKHAGNSYPLREGKGTTFEGGHRVPCVIWMPQSIAEGIVVDKMAAQIDWFPTIAHICKANLPDTKIDGVNLWDLLLGKDVTPRKEFFFYKAATLEAYRKKDYKLHLPHGYWTPTNELIEIGKTKLKQERKEIELSLFNLQTNISEDDNKRIDDEEIIKKMKKRMQTFDEKLQKNKRKQYKVKTNN